MKMRDKYKKQRDVVNYKKLRNLVVKMIREAKTVYYRILIEVKKKDSKTIWKYLNELVPNGKYRRNKPTLLTSDGKDYTDQKEIANLFNNFFVNISKNTIQDSHNSPNLYINTNLINDFVNSRCKNGTKFSIPPMSSDLVCKLLKKLDQAKSKGPDSLGAKILKISAEGISQTITKIINMSIESGTFPNKWKEAKVIPIHKSGALNEKENYRPISILNIISKIYERHLHDTLYSYLSSQNLLHSEQSGFRRFHSCETALLKLVDTWTKAMDEGELNGVLFLDLRKAFDSIDHYILIEKLKCYNIQPGAIKLYQSYLSNRTQFTVLFSEESNKQVVKSGVPQGSILGPLLFLLFINDMSLNIDSHTDMYADDSTITVTGKTIQVLEDKLQNGVDNIVYWCRRNNMRINVMKTKVMLITTNRRASMIPNKLLQVKIKDTYIENVTSHKLLGVIVDNTLSWKQQVLSVQSAASRKLTLLVKIAKYLPIETRKTFYISYILSSLLYSVTVWGRCSDIDKLEKLQKRSARILLNIKDVRTNSKSLFIMLGWIPLKNMILLKIAVIVYKSLNGLLPQYMRDMFKYIQEVQTRTRNSTQGKLYIPKQNHKFRQNTLSYQGPNTWNSIPFEIRRLNMVNNFIKKCTDYFREHIL